MEEVGQFPSVADYSRLLNLIEDLTRDIEQKRRTKAIYDLRKKRTNTTSQSL